MGADVGRESDDETGRERPVEARGERSIAAGRDIGQAVTGDHATVNNINGGTFGAPVIQARDISGLYTGPQYTGDHNDFRGAEFHDKVVAKEEHNHTEHNYYGNVPAPAQWKPVTEVEPWEFGVGETRHIPGQPDVPRYVPRDCDEELRTALGRPGLVLILGEPYAGKSYTAWQGVRSLEGHVFYAPGGAEDLRHVPAALRGGRGKYVVWLDEFDHLGEGVLEPGLLNKLTGLGVVVVGTMHPDEYYRRRARTAPSDRVVAKARTVLLPSEWSEDELARLWDSGDPRAYPAYEWSGKEGPASYFAVGHQLFDEWQREGTRARHPRGQLLVRTAVDLARCGVMTAVPIELLRSVHEKYGAVEGGESFEEARAWATERMFRVPGLLVAGEEADTWRAHGALVAEAVGSGTLEPVPDEVWWALLCEVEDAAQREVLRDAAYLTLWSRIEAGDSEVAHGLGVLMGGDKGEALLRRAADAGHVMASVDLAWRLLDREDEQAALPYLERAASDGNTWAALQLGRLHRKRAEHWLRQAAEAGDGEAAQALGEMLLASGGGETLRWYTKAVKAGHKEVATSLGRALSYRGNKGDAEYWLRRGAELEEPDGVHSLAVFLHRLGGHDVEVEQLYRRAEELGHPAASRNLGNLLLHTGAVEEGEELLRQEAVRGSGDAAYWLSKHLRNRGNAEEADRWLHKAAELDHYYAMRRLSPLPVPSTDQPTGQPTGQPDTVTE
ncbi:tetratricopeptide repeat protein [Streptomyces sp. NPDC002643]